jgi:hypothetical protein
MVKLIQLLIPAVAASKINFDGSSGADKCQITHHGTGTGQYLAITDETGGYGSCDFQVGGVHLVEEVTTLGDRISTMDSRIIALENRMLALEGNHSAHVTDAGTARDALGNRIDNIQLMKGDTGANGAPGGQGAKGSKGDAGANSPTPLVGENCYQLKQQGNTANGEYTLTIGSSSIVVYCDMTGAHTDSSGGYALMVNIPSGNAQGDYAGVTGAGGTAATRSAFSKLSDADINLISGSTNMWKLMIKSQYASSWHSRFVSRAAGFTSLRSQTGWQMDRNNDGTPDCSADRSGYVFADYPDMPLNGGASNGLCNTGSHMDYGESSSNTGVYSADMGGWGTAATIWWGPSGATGF